MGKGEAARAGGLGEAAATQSCGGEADKAELPFPSSNTGNGLTGKPGQLLEEPGSCSAAQSASAGVAPCGCRLRFSMAEGSRNRLNKSLSTKTYTQSILPWATGGLDDLSRSLPTNPCFRGLCGSRSGTHACDLVTVLKLNGKITRINNLINLFFFPERPLCSSCSVVTSSIVSLP